MFTPANGVPVPEFTQLDHINLTSHADAFGVDPVPISWGHPDPGVRGPVICTVRHSAQRNAIGAHSGSYSIYTGLAVASGKLNPDYVPNLKLTSPVFNIGPHKSWSDPKKVGCLDPFGHLTTEVYGDYLDKGWDIRPTIAVTKAHIDLPECREAIASGRLVPDGKILMASGQSVVAKAAIEPVWYLPEVARRFGCTESVLRQSIFRMTNGMYPELITRPDIKIFLPPIGGLTIYMWGDPDTIPDEDIELTCRVHDECNGSDVFGSDICTCRPYLTHAIEECIKTAQKGGCGIVIYFRKVSLVNFAPLRMILFRCLPIKPITHSRHPRRVDPSAKSPSIWFTTPERGKKAEIPLQIISTAPKLLLVSKTRVSKQ
jgi:GTP cyclohydrolase II